MDLKSLHGVEIKNADRGEVAAVFSTYNVIDAHGDVTLAGAFTNGAEVAISAYDHQTWQGSPPVGKGRIRTTGNEAILDGQFFMNTTAGRETFEIVKGLGPLQEWSYGYEVKASEPGEHQGQRVRFLKSLFVREVSPVFIGAGINTRTLAVKNGMPGVGGQVTASTYLRAIRPHETDLSAKAWNTSTSVKSISDHASVDELRSVYAWVDGDPEAKSSYRFAHHEGVNGPANLRACVIGIAELNTKSALADEDKQAIYDHLAAHLRDADQEPPELLTSSGKGLKLKDELAVVLCNVAAVNERIAEVVALRTQKGRSSLSGVNAMYLTWIDEELRRTKSLLNSPEEDAAYELARFLKFQLGEL